MQGSYSNSRTPLWLNANKYGLSSLTASNGYVRGMATYNKEFLDGDLNLQLGADVALPVGYKIEGYKTYTQKFIIQQAFAEVNWKYGVLTIGSKQQPMELKNNELSSGSQTLGIILHLFLRYDLALIVIGRFHILRTGLVLSLTSHSV